MLPATIRHQMPCLPSPSPAPSTPTPPRPRAARAGHPYGALSSETNQDVVALTMAPHTSLFYLQKSLMSCTNPDRGTPTCADLDLLVGSAADAEVHTTCAGAFEWWVCRMVEHRCRWIWTQVHQ